MKKFFKKLLLALLGIVLILFVVLSVNASLLKSKQSDYKPSDTKNISGEAINHLADAIKIKTISYEDKSKLDTLAFQNFMSFLQQTYPLVDSFTERKVINKYGLLYKWEGSNPDKKPILLLAHYDVVPVEEGTAEKWSHPPFSGEIADGFIWGRGTMDDKYSVIGIMEAMEHLLKAGYKPERTVYAAFGFDEEIGGKEGAGKIVEYLKQQGVRFEFSVDEGMMIMHQLVPGIDEDVALIGISEKGYLSVKLTLNYEGGHSSFPKKETTIDIMANAIVNLKEHRPEPVLNEPMKQFIDYVGPEMPFGQKIFFANTWLFKSMLLKFYTSTATGNSMVRTTTAPTIFKSGVKDNVLPTTATATVNFRIVPGQTVDDIVAHIKNTINDERIKIEVLAEQNPSQVSSADSESFKVLEKSIKKSFGKVLVAPTLVIATTDSKHYEPIVDDVYRFGPQVVDKTDAARVHGIDERLNVENFKKAILFYMQVIENAD